MPTLITFLTFIFVILPSQGLYSVTDRADAVTYYQLAHINEGADVILAHENLAGAAFAELETGDMIRVGYPDGVRLYQVKELQRYTATDPRSVYSYFKRDGLSFSSVELVALLYVPDRLILQTCYDNARGRLFVIAEPVRIERKAEAR